jgi:hypothetical protein
MGAVGKVKYLKGGNGHWNMQSRELLRRLGFDKPSSPIPKDFQGKFNIDGVEITVTLPPVEGRRKHRILAKCPDCGSTLPAGRLHQHTGTKVCSEIQADKRDIDNALDAMGMGKVFKV